MSQSKGDILPMHRNNEQSALVHLGAVTSQGAITA